MTRGSVKLGLFIGLEIRLSYGVAGVNIVFGVIWKCKWEVIKSLRWELLSNICVQLVQLWVCFHFLSYHHCQLSLLTPHWQYCGVMGITLIVCHYHLHFSPRWLLVLEQLREQLWYWLTVILERVYCQCQTKLVKKILKFEFIECMSCSRKHGWETRKREGKERSGGASSQKECPNDQYTTMGAMFPGNAFSWERTHSCMYQATIVRCYRDFKDFYWVQCNQIYRCQVAITKDTMLGRVIPLQQVFRRKSSSSRYVHSLLEW